MCKGRLLIISGPSGTGKGSIVKRVMKEMDNLFFSVSMTTRKMRPREVEGKNYHFVSCEEFINIRDEGGLLEYAQVYDNYYGTPRDKVFEMLDQGMDVVLELDIQGAMEIKKNFDEGIYIFILPPSMVELRERITGRGTESKDIINTRLKAAIHEIEYLNKYDYCVVNDNLQDAICRVKSIIRAERCRITGDMCKIIEKYKESLNVVPINK